MYSFSSNNGYAFIEAVDVIDRRYTLYLYADKQARDAGKTPLEIFNIKGHPNIQECLSVLGEGYIYDGGDLPLEPIPPETVTQWQIRRWLIANGISMTTIEQMIDSIDDNLKREQLRIDWEYAQSVKRSHPILIEFATSLGMDEKAIDQAFVEAEKFE